MEDYYKEEVYCANEYLDNLGIPKEDDGGTFSLVGRIKQLEKRMLQQASEVEDYYLRQLDK